ncbi:MAG TPA: hypothetical protein VFX35_12390 [Solirubrobacterales bacterium]|nr:hypothetical protein [Solirubrobacterales bacterium]
MLEAFRFALDLLLAPPFFEPAFEDDFLVTLVAAFRGFDAAFLPLLLALAFAFDPDFAAFDDFDFDPGFDLLVARVDLPVAFLSAI